MCYNFAIFKFEGESGGVKEWQTWKLTVSAMIVVCRNVSDDKGVFEILLSVNDSRISIVGAMVVFV